MAGNISYEDYVMALKITHKHGSTVLLKRDVVAALPTVPNPTVCCGHLVMTLQLALARRFSLFTFSEFIFLSFKSSRSIATISIPKDSSRDILKAQSL